MMLLPSSSLSEEPLSPLRRRTRDDRSPAPGRSAVEHLVHRLPGVGLVHRRLLLPGRHRRRRRLPLRSARSPRRPPRPAHDPHRLSDRAGRHHHRRPAADHRSHRPERFWHMVWMSDTGGPMFKPYSAISLGIWIILALRDLRGAGRDCLLSWSRKSETEVGSTDHRTTDDLRPTTVWDKIVALGCILTGSALGVHRARPDRHQPAALGRHRLDHPPLPPLRHLGGARR